MILATTAPLMAKVEYGTGLRRFSSTLYIVGFKLNGIDGIRSPVLVVQETVTTEPNFGNFVLIKYV